jgi:hypothetical protein
MPGQQFGQVLLEDRYTTFAEGPHPCLVIVYADNLMAHFGKANCRNESHVSRPDYTDGNWILHRLFVSPLLLSAGVSGTSHPGPIWYSINVSSAKSDW